MAAVVAQPAGEQFLLTQVKDDPTKIDLDFAPRPIRAGMLATARVAASKIKPDFLLEADFFAEMMVGGKVAIELFNAWKSNTVLGDRNFPNLDAEVAKTPGFTAAATAFEAEVKANLSAQFRAGNIDYHDLVTGGGPVRKWSDVIPGVEPGKATSRALPSLSPPGPSLSLTSDRVAKICIGSFQGVSVKLSDFKASTSSPATFSGTLKYELRDHFGVDDDDCDIAIKGLHGTPGQIAMWILQHHSRPGHMPWITVVKVDRTISGVL